MCCDFRPRPRAVAGQATFLPHFAHQPSAETAVTENLVAHGDGGVIRIVTVDGRAIDAGPVMYRRTCGLFRGFGYFGFFFSEGIHISNTGALSGEVGVGSPMDILRGDTL